MKITQIAGVGGGKSCSLRHYDVRECVRKSICNSPVTCTNKSETEPQKTIELKKCQTSVHKYRYLNKLYVSYQVKLIY